MRTREKFRCIFVWVGAIDDWVGGWENGYRDSVMTDGLKV